MRIDFEDLGSELTSSNWLETLARVPNAVRRARGPIEVDLSSLTWIGHLPLLALCLGVQEISHAKFDERKLIMPRSLAVRIFLERWHFYEFAREHKFTIDSSAPVVKEADAVGNSRVLEIRKLERAGDAKELRDAFRQTDTDLRKLLQTNAFLTEREIHGLADLIIFELCENALEHGERRRAAVIFGRVSRENDPTRKLYKEKAADWERAFFNSIRNEGMTELVIGDAGIGIISSLREQASQHGISDPAEVLQWAFEPFSTRKHERSEHTRGLWAVKNKVRELRGILYVRSGVRDGDRTVGGRAIRWDFFTEPSGSKPKELKDEVPFPGTQVQILLPHRTEIRPYTFIEYHRPLLTRKGPQIVSREISVPMEPEPLELSAEIRSLPPNVVPFIEMSQMDEERWTRGHVDGIGRQIFDIFRRKEARVWLLNPPATVVQELASSVWVVDLWKERAILLPYLTLDDPDRPPHISYVVKDPTLRSKDSGDTEAARRRLVNLIGRVVESGETINVIDEAKDLTHDEQNWLTSALALNGSLVDSMAEEPGTIATAMDVEKLGWRAVSALLGRFLHNEITRKIQDQTHGRPMWYRLPSLIFCKHYIDPRIFADLPPTSRSALEKWVEERIAQIGADYAISYTTFANDLLTRAQRTGSIRTLRPLRHYSISALRDELKAIKEKSTVVLLASISGSGRTIADAVSILREKGVVTSVISIIDTMTDAERQTLIDALGSRERFFSRTRWPIEKWQDIPPHEKHIPIAIIDPETLLPVVQVQELPTRFRDGEFWRYLAESEAATVGDITYKGIAFTTMIWTRHLLKHPGVIRKLIQDFRNAFRDSPGQPLGPHRIVFTQDTKEVMTEELLEALTREFPKAEIDVGVDALDLRESKEKFEGQFVVIFSAASNSGAGIAQLQKYFQTAKRVHIAVLISRIPDGVLLALTGPGTRVTLSEFQRLVSGSPTRRLGSSHSVAVAALREYRCSSLSNRLLLFIEELSRRLSRKSQVAQSADELQVVVKPDDPPAIRFQDNAVFSFSSAEGREALQHLVRECATADENWLYGILDEVASRAEAEVSNFKRHPKTWERNYIEHVWRLYESGRQSRDLTARSVILKALLLDRWLWHERSRRDPEDRAAIGESREDISPPFARELLGDLEITRDHDFQAVVIRSMSKVGRVVLIQSLDRVIALARWHRTTELTLALELTKIIDDEWSAELLLEKLTDIVSERERNLPAGREEPFDVALRDLLGDVGLAIFRDPRESWVDFQHWSDVKAQLADEPPDHDRTVRALIRAMRGRFGRHARFLYIRERIPGRYAHGDAWPWYPISASRTVPFANLKAVDLLGDDRDFFYSEKLGDDPRPEARAYLEKLPNLNNWSVALYRMRRRKETGLFRVWQDLGKSQTPLSRKAADEMMGAIADAAALIDRPRSAVRVIGEWQYEKMIGNLERKREGDTFVAVDQFAERLRLLLGGDVVSHLWLDEEKRRWVRRYLGGRAAHPYQVEFAADEVDESESAEGSDPPKSGRRLTNVVAREKRGRIYATHAAALEEGFDQALPVDWAEAWMALPLVHGTGKCRSVVHIWHHIPHWFDQAERIMPALQSLGGTLVELSFAYRDAQEARQIRSFDRLEQDRLTARLLNLLLAAEGIASGAKETNQGVPDLDVLANTIQQTQQAAVSLIRLLQVQVRQPEPVPVQFEGLVTDIVTDARERYGADLFDLSIPEPLPVLMVRRDMMGRAIEELLKNAKAHLAPAHRVRVELGQEGAAVVLEVSNPGYGMPEHLRETMWTAAGAGGGLLLAKAAAERHGGTLEVGGTPGEDTVVRMILPSPIT